MFGSAEELRGGAAPAEWQGEVEPLWLSYEANPFTGRPFFNEVRAPARACFSCYVQVACTSARACLSCNVQVACTSASACLSCNVLLGTHISGSVSRCVLRCASAWCILMPRAHDERGRALMAV